MNGMDKLFAINLWRWTQGLKEWPVPGVSGFPNPCGLSIEEVKEHNSMRTRSEWLRSLPELDHIFKDEELNKQRDLGFLMGYFRYENPNSLDYRPNANGVNKDYCLKRSQQKWDMFRSDLNITYIIDIMNLIELWFVGQSFNKGVDITESIQFKGDHHCLVRSFIAMYNFWKLYKEYNYYYLKWTDDSRPEQGLGA